MKPKRPEPPTPITEPELAEIHKSVLEATRRVSIAKREGIRERKLTAKVYDVALFKADALLDELCYSPRPRLSDRRIKPVLLSAIGRDDKRFFIRLGNRLSKKPIEPGRVSQEELKVVQCRFPRQLVQFLIGHWASASEELPELFYLTPAGLADVCSHYLRRELSIDAVVKLRQRLGLKPFKRHKIHVIRLGNKLKFLK